MLICSTFFLKKDQTNKSTFFSVKCGHSLHRGAGENIIDAQAEGFEENTPAGDCGQCQRNDQKDRGWRGEKAKVAHSDTSVGVAPAWLLDPCCPERRNTGAEANVG